ncbi:MAG: DUF87 domain-containing protein [Candidatus Diapherotrites archaeon]
MDENMKIEKTDIFDEILVDPKIRKAKQKLEEEIDSALEESAEEESEEEEDAEEESDGEEIEDEKEVEKEEAIEEETESEKESEIGEDEETEEIAEKKKPKKRGRKKKIVDIEEEKGEEEKDAEEESEKENESGEFEEESDDAEEKENEEVEEEKEINESVIPKSELKKLIIEKAVAVSKTNGDQPFMGAEKLDFLKDESGKKVFIGRKRGIFKKHGFEAGLFVGRVKEPGFQETNVFMDSLNPHVVFACGARGSGKSYLIGVMAEELAKKNKNVGLIVVDPIGVFWSMRYPNKEAFEVEKLREWGFKPEGLNNLKVFIPAGAVSNTPKSTFDESFSLRPSLLTGEDWCLTFGIERFSVTGLLMDKTLEKSEKGYTRLETEEYEEKGEDGKIRIKSKETAIKIKAKGKDYSIEDIIECLMTDSEINSRDKGYKQDSVRALVSRFEAAKNWGIFSNKGTPLSKLSKSNQLTILDTSFLDDNVTALVIGVLARRVLAARKILTRKEAAKKFKEFDVEQLLEVDIPPTWMFIDEAHTLIPGGNEKTPATSALVEYVKQGRRPGCSLVFATQQPSAIDTKVLSQLDIIMIHKLVFDDDVKAVYKRTPTLIPQRYRKSTFIKTLPVGIALTGDRREETTRAFVLEVRPRMSQHEGRDAETSDSVQSLDDAQVKSLAVDLITRNIKEKGEMTLTKVEEVVDALNSKYQSSLDFDDLSNELGEKGLFLGKEVISLTKQEEYIEEDEPEPEEPDLETKQDLNEGEKAETQKEKHESETQPILSAELKSLPLKIKKDEAVKIVSRFKKNAFLGVFGESEKITSLNLVYSTLYEIEFLSKNRAGEFVSHKCFIDSKSCEFIHFKDNNFVYSSGLKELGDLSSDEVNILRVLLKGKTELNDLLEKNDLKEERGKRLLTILFEKQFIASVKEANKGKQFFFLKKKLDLPLDPGISLLESISKMPFVQPEAVRKEFENYSKDDAVNALKKLWPRITVKKTNELLQPKWIATLNAKGMERKLFLDGVTGKPVE